MHAADCHQTPGGGESRRDGAAHAERSLLVAATITVRLVMDGLVVLAAGVMGRAFWAIWVSYDYWYNQAEGLGCIPDSEVDPILQPPAT